jgi:outer membrane protein OmpA-like peptidoglycan-associated protein
MLVLVTVVLAVAGFFLFDFSPEGKPRWSLEEIAPQKYEALPSKQIEPPPPEPTPQKAVITKQVEDNSAVEPVEPVAQTKETSPVMQKVMPFPEKKIVIYFKRNSNELPDTAIEILDRIAEFMIQSQEAHLSINGYTDSSGSRSYNVSVSQFRANSVKSYLAGKGVALSNIKAVGFGPENPTDTNKTEAGRRRNRRVEIELNLVKGN